MALLQYSSGTLIVCLPGANSTTVYSPGESEVADLPSISIGSEKWLTLGPGGRPIYNDA